MTRQKSRSENWSDANLALRGSNAEMKGSKIGQFRSFLKEIK